MSTSTNFYVNQFLANSWSRPLAEKTVVHWISSVVDAGRYEAVPRYWDGVRKNGEYLVRCPNNQPLALVCFQ